MLCLRLRRTGRGARRRLGGRLLLQVVQLLLQRGHLLLRGRLPCGDLLRGRGEHAEAASLYERALQARIDAVDAIYGAAASYAALGRVGDAVQPLRRAARLDPSRLDVHRLLASSLVALGQKQDALAAFGPLDGRDG